MGVLQDFERRLEGAVEGFFARTFRSGLQPIELAKGVQRYAEDRQHVTSDGVVVPNVYRFHLNPRDQERLATFGPSLTRELSQVVARTAEEHAWLLRGPAKVVVEVSENVRFGRYELAGRVEEVEESSEPIPVTGAPSSPRGDGTGLPSSAAPSAVAEPPPAKTARLVLTGTGRTFPLIASRAVVGRAATADVTIDDQTVSREHATLVRRGETWWVVDLGSTNGTTVNGVTAAEQPLSPGDRIEFGEAVVEFQGG